MRCWDWVSRSCTSTALSRSRSTLTGRPIAANTGSRNSKGTWRVTNRSFLATGRFNRASRRSASRPYRWTCWSLVFSTASFFPSFAAAKSESRARARSKLAAASWGRPVAMSVSPRLVHAGRFFGSVSTARS